MILVVCVCVLFWFAVFVSIFYIVSRESLLRRGYILILEEYTAKGWWRCFLFLCLILFYSEYGVH